MNQRKIIYWSCLSILWLLVLGILGLIVRGYVIDEGFRRAMNAAGMFTGTAFIIVMLILGVIQNKEYK